MTPFKTLMSILMLTVLALGTIIAIYSLSERTEDSRRLDHIPVSIEELRINIPRSYFRGGGPASQRLSERADLVMLYPEMTAAAVAPTKLAAAPDPLLLVFASIQRNDGVLDPAERVQELYGRFLEPATFENPGGLLMRRFSADSPYSDEELFIAPPDGRVFTARCRKPDISSEQGIGETCIWRFRQAGADIQIRFSPALLPHWEEMALGVARRLKEWEGK
jgi:hypothetical protein